MPIRISLALIVSPTKKAAKQLDAALSSVEGIFDDIQVTVTGTCNQVEMVAAKHGAHVSHFEWIDNFAKARNFNFEQCTGDWIVWMDADDLLKGGENLRAHIELADANNVEGLAFLYEYAHDDQGNVTDKHWKTQAVKNNGHAEWRGIIHEDLLPKRPANYASVSDVIRVHTATAEDAEASLQRNVAILEKAVAIEPGEPRHYFYLARCYVGLADWHKVLEAVASYLKLSGWKEERYEALNMAGEAHMRMGDLDTALQTFQDAILQNEDAPDAYIYKARVYIQKEEWLNALTNLEIAERRDPDAAILKRTALYDHDLYVLCALCFLQLGKFDRAIACAKKAHDKRGTKDAKELLDLATKMQADDELVRLFRKLGGGFIDDLPRLRTLLSLVPPQIADDPRILQLQFAIPKVWPQKSVVFFCGGTPEAWDGTSLSTGGIGGSETAVVQLANRFAASGYQVTVFNRCEAEPDGRVVDGVTYKNYWQFNKDDTFDVLILWRSPNILHYDIKARKIIVDMHDVSSPEVFTPQIVAKLDHVFVKSEYHKSLFPTVPEEKVVVLGNGIDLKRFHGLPQKVPTRFVYTSAPNRGLEVILDVWERIRERIPNAELHVYYGWKTFYELLKHDPTKMEWMEGMKRKMQQPGIIDHGRVGQDKLAKDLLKSSLWLYPTEFPEVHCITALEMQAAGVVPVTTGFAALAETQKTGVKLPGDPKTAEWQSRFVEAVVEAYEGSHEVSEGYRYAQECSWDNVASIWMKFM